MEKTNNYELTIKNLEDVNNDYKNEKFKYENELNE